MVNLNNSSLISLYCPLNKAYMYSNTGIQLVLDKNMDI